MTDFSSEAVSVLSSDSMLATAIDPDEQFLRLQLGAKTPMLLPVQQLTEVLTIPENQIMPIPYMPAWVMGVYNWRGEILWMIDLGHLCGLAPWYESPTYRSTHLAVVLNLLEPAVNSPGVAQTLGLVVQRIEDIECCPLQAIQPWPPANIPLELIPFAAGYWQSSEQESLAILDGRAILQRIST